MKKLYLFILMTMLSISIHCQTHWIKYDDNPVLTGYAGQWDEHLDYIGSVLYYDNQYHMWYNGYTNSHIWNVGYATSPDGINWTKDSNNPVFGAGEAGSWDQDYATCGDVTMINDTLHMWYTGYKGYWDQSAIGHAYSTDGVNWTRDPGNPVLTLEMDGSVESGWMMIDEVVYDGNHFHMWYEAANMGATEGQTGHATSTGGSEWTVDPSNPAILPGNSEDWDYPVIGLPEVVYDGSIFHMWYAGGNINPSRTYDIGYATSTDGSSGTWVKYSGNPVLRKGAAGSWDKECLWSGTVLDSAGIKYKMWYRGTDGSSSAFGYAESDTTTTGFESNTISQIRIFPIPATDFLTLQIIIQGHSKIEITSLNGNLLYNQEIEGSHHQIDLSSFRKGVYFITIRSKDFVTTRKIIKL